MSKKTKKTPLLPTLPPDPTIPDRLPFAALALTYLTQDQLPSAPEFEEMAPFLLASPAWIVLSQLKSDALWKIHRTSHLLCQIGWVFLTTSEQRSRNHRQVAGGRAHPQRFHPRDLLQKVPGRAPLALKTGSLCRQLLKEAPVLIRLLRAARRAYRRSPDDLVWKAAHEAAVRVALRILQVCAALYEQTKSWWYVEVCLRHAFRQTWAALFGPTARLTDDAQPWLAPVEMPMWREREVLAVLTKEGVTPKGKPGPNPPEPFAGVVAAWQAGDLPEALTCGPLTRETGQRLRFLV